MIPIVVGFWVIPTVLIFAQDKPGFLAIIRYVDSTSYALFSGAGPASPLVFFLFYMMGLALIITIHELGHLAAGRAVGFHFKAIRIGPLQFMKSAQGLKVTFQRLSDLSGFAAIRIDKIQRLGRRYAIFIAGGPLANLLSALLIFVLLAILPPAHAHGFIRPALQIFAALSTAIAIINLIPFRRTNGMYSDGGRLLHLARSLHKTRRLLCILALRKQTDSGVPLKSLKRTWIVHACAHPDRSSDSLNAFFIAYLAESARDDVEQAAQHLEHCLSRFRYSSLYAQKMMLMEAANFQAWFRSDEPKAEVWFRKSERSGPAPFLNQLRLKIAMDWAGRRYDDLYKAWDQGRVHIESFPESPAKSVLLNSWLEWKDEIQKRRTVRESAC
ncbi:MAG TPA: M50 family metallopeptidase [Candidatus Acidoferrum sp.]|nr:M50 family metallopeptidase [Candidatus Acidoferrum sp.]